MTTKRATAAYAAQLHGPAGSGSAHRCARARARVRADGRDSVCACARPKTRLQSRGAVHGSVEHRGAAGSPAPTGAAGGCRVPGAAVRWAVRCDCRAPGAGSRPSAPPAPQLCIPSSAGRRRPAERRRRTRSARPLHLSVCKASRALRLKLSALELSDCFHSALKSHCFHIALYMSGLPDTF